MSEGGRNWVMLSGKGLERRGLRVNFQLYVFGCYMPGQCEYGP